MHHEIGRMDQDALKRFGPAVGAGAAIVVAGFLGSKYLERPADVVFEAPGAVKTVGSLREAATVAAPKVHVHGKVAKPGVYTLPPDARVQDAIRAAGGAIPGADLDQLNLAARVQDASDIWVPAKAVRAPSREAARQSRPRAMAGQLPPMKVDITPLMAQDRPAADPKVDAQYRSSATSQPAVESGPVAEGRSSTRSSSGKKEMPTGTIDINRANAAELQRLPGVGPATAAKILEYRQSVGGFRSVDQLLDVKGIGPKKLEAMRKYVRV